MCMYAYMYSFNDPHYIHHTESVFCNFTVHYTVAVITLNYYNLGQRFLIRGTRLISKEYATDVLIIVDVWFFHKTMQ